MARILLWFITFLGLVTLVVGTFTNQNINYFQRIVIISCLGVLAICESIEKRAK